MFMCLCGWEAALTLAKLNMLGVHFFESLCPYEDKMSIKKVFHFWTSEIAACMCGQSSLISRIGCARYLVFLKDKSGKLF